MTRPQRPFPWRRRVRVVLNVALPALIAGAVTLVFNASKVAPGNEVTIFVIGAVLIAAGILFQVWRAISDDMQVQLMDSDANDMFIAMKSSLFPLAQLLSEMPNQSETERREKIKEVAGKATEVLAYLLLKHVPRVRANVFILNPENTRLSAPWSSSVTGERPGTFYLGGASAENALTRVKAGTELVVDDVETDPPPGFSYDDPPYRSFVSIPMTASGYSYGMVTVDSPKPGVFTVTDVETVRVVAKLLAVGFAAAYPGESTGSTS